MEKLNKESLNDVNGGMLPEHGAYVGQRYEVLLPVGRIYPGEKPFRRYAIYE